MQRRHDFAKNIGRVRHRPAEQAAVQIVARATDEDLRIAEPAQAVGDRGHTASKLVRIANDRDVGLERIPAMLPQSVRYSTGVR